MNGLTDVSRWPVYSPLPAWHTEAAAASDYSQRVQLDGPALYVGRDAYPPLPWTFSELVPSAWRNSYTGGLFQVGELRYVSEHHPYPSLVEAGGQRWPASIGLWWNQRFVIEHWLRVDHLPVAVQLQWFALELGYHRRRLAEVQISRHRERFDVEAIQRAIQAAERAARQFAIEHTLPLLPDECVRVTPQGLAVQSGLWADLEAQTASHWQLRQ